MKFNIWYKSPKHTERKSHTTEDIYKVRTITTIIEDKIKIGGLKVPIAARIHPAGLQELSKLSCEHKNVAGYLANILITMLKTKEQENTITVSYDELAKFTKLSVRTIASNMSFLEDHDYITRVGKQSYKISPYLAWFGNEVEWSEKLLELGITETDKEKNNG